MKLTTIALATAFALSSSFALAQAGAGSGTSVPETSGAGVNGGSGAVGTTNNGEPRNNAEGKMTKGTTGMSHKGAVDSKADSMVSPKGPGGAASGK